MLAGGGNDFVRLKNGWTCPGAREAGLEGEVYAVRGKGELKDGIPLTLVTIGLGSADDISIGLELVPCFHSFGIGEEGVVENIEGPSQVLIPSCNSLERSLVVVFFVVFEGPACLDLTVGIDMARRVVSPP